MRFLARAFPIVLLCLSTAVGFSQKAQPSKVPDSVVQSFFADFNLPAAANAADARLRRSPRDTTALLVRMETAELQERPEAVLDSALRLCALPAAPELHDLASNRVLQHAANSAAFNTVLRRVKSAAAIHNGCTFNLRLALLAASSDGPNIDLDTAALSSGLLTRWRIAGPFGRYNNVDFDRRWLPETERSFRERYASEQDRVPLTNEDSGAAATKANSSHATIPERFWFRDGMITLPQYFASSGIFYAVSEVEVAAGTARIDVLSSGTYEIFVDGKSRLRHDARYATGPTRDSTALFLASGHHRVLLKFTPDAAPISVALHPEYAIAPPRKIGLPAEPAKYTQALGAYFRGDYAGMGILLHADSVHGDGYSKYLQALLYSAAEEHSPRADAAWKAVASAQPSALLARLKSAENAMERGQPEGIRSDVMSILADRPQSETALQLAFNLSRHNQLDGPALLARLLDSHASCARLAEAIKFYNAAAQQDKALERGAATRKVRT